MHPISYIAVGLGLLAMTAFGPSQPQDPALPPGGHYIGAAQCKNCHNGADKGNAYDHWSSTPHAKAFKTLGEEKAKKIAKEMGIDDPQTSEKCLKCHETAYGLDAKLIAKTFKPEDGVQCETCHGPGETHKTKRVREAMKKGAEPSPIAADEVHAGRTLELCTKCHNKESPTYKPFCLVERMEKIEHLDPRKKRTDEELKKLRGTCAPDCEICKARQAGGPHDAGAKKDAGGK